MLPLRIAVPIIILLNIAFGTLIYKVQRKEFSRSFKFIMVMQGLMPFNMTISALRTIFHI